ncbi:hypothetical protein OHR68_20135 [Spirillospora sp. NBC_00431]
MRVHQRILSTGFVFATASALFLGLAPAASAGTNTGYVRTKDGNPGGKAAFFHKGDKISVCDINHDGYYAQAELHTSARKVITVTAKGHGNCTTKSKNLPEGTRVYVYVFLRKDGSRKKYWPAASQGWAKA